MNRFLKMGFIGAVILVFMTGIPGLANVTYRAGWKPEFVSEVLKAPSPPRLEEREKIFQSRNSPENLKLLADEFFGMMDLNRVPPEVKQRYDKGDYAGALEAYRDFFIDRLVFPPEGHPLLGGLDLGARLYRPKQPGQRLFYEFLATGGDLMSNIVVFAMKDKDGKKGNVRMDRGAPGRFNWTWSPEGYRHGGHIGLPEVPVMIPMCMGYPNFFSELLVEYMNTHDKACLDKWSEYLDDMCLNWKNDLREAKIKASTDWHYVLEIYTHDLWLNFAYLARTVPEFRGQLSAPTLARMLVQLWKYYVPICIRGARQDGPNRRIGMKGTELWYMCRFLPEFKAADYCLREFRRLREMWPETTALPDCVVPEELTHNYYLVYPLACADLWHQLRSASPIPEWLTAEWVKEMDEGLNLRAKYFFHSFLNDGSWLWCAEFATRHLNPTWLTMGEYPRFLRCFPPEGFIDPEVIKIRSVFFENGALGEPSFTSEAFPFGGQYIVRNGWGSDKVCAFMHNNPTISHGDNLGLEFFAYGKPFLRPMWRTAISPDGMKQVENGTGPMFFQTHYEAFLKQWEEAFINIKPQPNRWHSSPVFNLCEATWAKPFINRPYPNPSNPLWQAATNVPLKFIADLKHHRQLMLANEEGLLVVLDRVLSASPHQYRLEWNFMPFYLTNKLVVASRNALRTTLTNGPNLSIYHFGLSPMISSLEKDTKMDGDYDQYGCTFAGTGNEIVISALYPCRAGEEEKIQFSAGSPAGVGIVAFEALIPDGAKIICQGAAVESPLKAGDVEMRGESLLVRLAPDGACRGLALGCKEIKVKGRKQEVPSTDFEFAVQGKNLTGVIPIYRPLELVEINPQTNVFLDQVVVNMNHPDPEVEIHYTLDWSEPTLQSPRYERPFTLDKNTMIKARGIRKGVTRMPGTFAGTQVTPVSRAMFSREKLRPAAQVNEGSKLAPGLNVTYYEGDWTLSAMYLQTLKQDKAGVANELFDLSLKQTSNNYAFVYSGYLDIPHDGVYSFHAPPEFVYPGIDSGYDLRVEVDREEWYPTTRRHNYGVWSVPLAKGKHSLKVSWVDQRPGQAQWFYPYVLNEAHRIWRGEKPALLISGPGLEKQPIPTGMLKH
jgi:hypothetical protein